MIFEKIEEVKKSESGIEDEEREDIVKRCERNGKVKERKESGKMSYTEGWR